MSLLFLNSLKGLKRKKIQMLGIILLVMLGTGIYVAMSSAVDRMEESYYNYLDDQKVEHISADYNIDYSKLSKEEFDYIKENYLNNLTLEEQNTIDIYEYYLNGLIDSPFESVGFNYILDSIFSKYEADIYIKNQKFAEIKDKYDLLYELERSKSLKNDDTYLKIIPYNENKILNKVYLIEGKLPTNESEITMLPKYASKHNIKINDKYKIDDKEYKVVGFTYAPDYIYPLVSYSAILFDENKNNVIYMYNDDYKNIKGVEEKSYSIFYNGNIKRKFEIKDIENSSLAKIFDEENFTMSIISATRLGRIASLQLEFATDRLFAEYFLYLLLGIAIFVIIIITKKRIEDERLQIGVLKSLGYSPISISFSYLVYPIIGSLIGGIIGYLIGSFVNEPLAKYYISYFIIPLDKFKISSKYLTNSLVIPTLVLSILSYVIALFMLRKKPLYLLREGSNLKVNLFSKIVNKLTSFLPFKYRFKYSLAFRSIPKLIIVGLTSFFTGLLIVLTLIGMNLMQNVVDKTFSSMNYDYMIYMNTIESEKIDEKSDYIFSASLKLKEVKNKKIDKDLSINLTGIDKENRYINPVDIKNNKFDINENEIVINKNMENLYNIKVNDILVLTDEKKDYEFKVIGISEEYMNMTGYVLRKDICSKLGFNENCYSSILSKNKKYSNLNKLNSDLTSKIATIINFKDMKDNLSATLETYNASIYIVIIFASIMAFVIIAVIANIVVEENKKIISLMKVMGYKNKNISSIVLNIYTPVIIIAYILSIPCMIKILEKIVSILANDMEITIPISLDPSLAIIGLIGLLIAYYVAVSLSKRVLNKIPLSIALKRE